MAKRKSARKGPSPGLIVGALIVLLLAGGLVALVKIKGPPQTVGRLENQCTPTGEHEHASFRVYVHNTSVSYGYPQFNFNPRQGVGRLEAHLHLPAEHTMHMEGGATRCTTIAKAFRVALLGSLTPTTLRLDDEVHQGAVYRDGQDGELRFFLGRPPEEWYNQTARRYIGPSQVTWTEEPDLPYHQPRDGEYFLVTFGTESDAAIRWQQLSIPIQNASE